MLSLLLLVSTVFGTVSSLHPTSFLMIFTLVLYKASQDDIKTTHSKVAQASNHN